MLRPIVCAGEINTLWNNELHNAEKLGNLLMVKKEAKGTVEVVELKVCICEALRINWM